jgi:hypothetical protein
VADPDPVIRLGWWVVEVDDTETGAEAGEGEAGYNKVEEGATVAKGRLIVDAADAACAAAAVAAANTTAACAAVVVDVVVVLGCDVVGAGATIGIDRDVLEGSMVAIVVIMEEVEETPPAAPVL